ncbi:MAG: phage tail protein I, partial [Synergistaceae bacterium]|nr:phage tail protein I [Synergistaceae bacterium]
WNPDTCPANLLPWLAWAFHADDWNDEWPEGVKRAVVRDSLEMHRRKGTVWAVKRALANVGYPVTLNEDTGQAYIFDLAVSLSDGANVEAAYQKVCGAATKAKNTRSHIGNISLGSKTTGTMHAGCVFVSGAKVEIQPWSSSGQETDAPLHAGGTTHQHIFITIAAAA